eukprot:Gb_04686 [translate_table: standard]
MKKSVQLVPPSMYLLHQLGIQGCVPCICDCLDPLAHGINALIYFPQTRRISISKVDNIMTGSMKSTTNLTSAQK